MTVAVIMPMTVSHVLAKGENLKHINKIKYFLRNVQAMTGR